MAAVMQERSVAFYTNEKEGIKLEMPSFTCCHCNRVVILNPERQRPRNTCRKCMALTCDSGGCLVDCNPFGRDLERAYRNEGNQPWLLRHHGEPIDRIYDAAGNELLVLRKGDGHTQREIQRMQRR